MYFITVYVVFWEVGESFNGGKFKVRFGESQPKNELCGVEKSVLV
jgi:hypothetical protein